MEKSITFSKDLDASVHLEPVDYSVMSVQEVDVYYFYVYVFFSSFMHNFIPM